MTMFDELREMNNLINQKQLRLDELRARLTSMNIPISERVQTSPCDFLPDLMCEIIIIENELNDMIDEYAKMKESAKLKIFTLDNEKAQDILYLHYIQFMSYAEISRIKGLRHNTVRTIARRNIKKLKCIIDETS